ncbi:hypothetical protein Rai3103_08315 [Raineyella fluvialis]|uniref:Uncharacterized protein n=1 Tax=Raineyella fluvialis TaxID=2662261 RepID=A0A5Q2FH79_9ACTN|nr:hypothetical protein Rai3103_08315 [Raineyella fluvialis]
MSTSATATRRHRPRLTSGGWIPNQHGAWAMVTIPWLLGTWQRFHDGQGRRTRWSSACSGWSATSLSTPPRCG